MHPGKGGKRDMLKLHLGQEPQSHICLGVSLVQVPQIAPQYKLVLVLHNNDHLKIGLCFSTQRHLLFNSQQFVVVFYQMWRVREEIQEPLVSGKWILHFEGEFRLLRVHPNQAPVDRSTIHC